MPAEAEIVTDDDSLDGETSRNRSMKSRPDSVLISSEKSISTAAPTARSASLASFCAQAEDAARDRPGRPSTCPGWLAERHHDREELRRGDR